jgi:quercetin dioxygenase-like cupin family protein
MSAGIDILDHAFIRMPCNACGKTYEVPLRDVLVSHTLVRCGCPVHDETECPPLFQIRLFDREPINALSSAWEQLERRASSDGGELVLRGDYTAHKKSTRPEPPTPQREHSVDGRLRHPVPTSGTLLIFDLSKEVDRLLSEQPWQAEHTANTIVKYPDLRVVLVALKAGGRLHEHRTASRISIQTLSGDICVHVEDGTVDMPAGSLLTLEHDIAHAVEAKTNSVFLLTIVWPK